MTLQQQVGHTTGAMPVACTMDRHSGLIAGAIVLTLKGEMPVQDIALGDRVITRDSGVATVTGVRKRRIRGRAVRIRAGSLGHTRPDRDVTLPAGQKILIRDWRAEALFGRKQALVPAERLADGEFVTVTEDQAMTVVELEFDAPHIVYADGLELAAADDLTVSA